MKTRLEWKPCIIVEVECFLPYDGTMRDLDVIEIDKWAVNALTAFQKQVDQYSAPHQPELRMRLQLGCVRRGFTRLLRREP